MLANNTSDFAVAQMQMHEIGDEHELTATEYHEEKLARLMDKDQEYERIKKTKKSKNKK